MADIVQNTISAEMVLQQIQWELLELAELQECKITEGKQE